MNRATSMFSLIRVPVAAALSCLAWQGAGAQTAPGPNVLYLAKPSVGDCGPGQVTMHAGAFMLPPSKIAAGLPPLQIRQFADAPETSKTGAPYSAVGTAETVQTLADGNRIVHSNSSHYYRDGSGRTRTELSLSAVGPFTLDESSTVVMITDPTTKQRIVLHPGQKRAEVLPLGAVGPAAGAGSRQAVEVSGGSVNNKTGDASSATGSPSAAPGRCTPGAAPVLSTTVQVGQKTFAGLTASGTRTEYTIPAGQIGNDQPISVTAEKWVNDELGVTLASTVHDPMIGDSQFYLTQIKRSEPDPSLFVVPADYTVTDVTASEPVIIRR
jgi:hypothetical protein